MKQKLFTALVLVLAFALGTQALAAFTLSSSAITGTGASSIDVGTLYLSGSTSGKVTISPAAAAGTYTLTLPIDDGIASQYLQTDGNGVLTWATAAGGTPTAITVADTTDTTSFVGLFTDATGDLGPKTDAAITYNATSGDFALSGITAGLNFSGAGDHYLYLGSDVRVYNYAGDDSLNFETSSGTQNMTMLSTGAVGIGTYGPTQKLEVNGGMRLNTNTAKPACSSSVRGTFWVAKGGAGVADTVEVCSKDGADAYAWRTLM
ncbi:MAG: hypothetical protein M3M85_04240 [bacterium]|nr:hypothetical protein [bacterium]